MFGKKIKKQAGKFEKVITGLIIGGAVASVFGASKTKRGKNFIKKTKILFSEFNQSNKEIFSKFKNIFKKKK